MIETILKNNRGLGRVLKAMGILGNEALGTPDMRARGDLTDAKWEKLSPLLPPQQAKSGGRPSNDHRTTINGILHILRTGAPWRDLPKCYGPWSTV